MDCLPNELYLEIFYNLDNLGLFACLLVSKQFYKTATNHSLWQSFIKKANYKQIKANPIKDYKNNYLLEKFMEKNKSQYPSIKIQYYQLKTIPKYIGLLKNLTQLLLCGNDITTIPKEIGQLTNLEILDLMDNKLTTIPKEIGQLTKLWSLSCAHNKLTTIPPEIGQLVGLRELLLHNNKLTTIPKELSQLVRLKGLDLYGNPITTIPKEVRKFLKKLIYL